MAQLQAESAVLTKEAGVLDGARQGLNQSRTNVDNVAGEIQGSWKGAAGTAAVQALAKFNEGHQKLEKELTDIIDNIQASGGKYSAADDEQASSLSSQMNI